MPKSAVIIEQQLSEKETPTLEWGNNKTIDRFNTAKENHTVSQTILIENKDNLMSPDFKKGETLLVNTQYKVVEPSGIFWAQHSHS